MTSRSQQRKLLENLFAHAEERYIHTPEYGQKCFDHVLGIYLEFGSYGAFSQSIDSYCGGSRVERIHLFSATMLCLGLGLDDFRSPELIKAVAAELRLAPTGKLSEVIATQASVPIPIVPPKLLDSEGILRFSVTDYLQVYQVPLIRDIKDAMLNPERWNAAALMIEAIRAHDPERCVILADALIPACHKAPFKPDDALRVAITGPLISGRELSERLVAVISEVAKDASPKDGSQAIPPLLSMAEAYSRQDDFDPSCFEATKLTDHCHFKVLDPGNSPSQMSVSFSELSNLCGVLEALVEIDAHFRGYGLGFRKKLVSEVASYWSSEPTIMLYRYAHNVPIPASSATNVGGLESGKSMGHVFASTSAYCEALERNLSVLDSDDVLFKTLCALLPAAESFRWQEVLVKKLIGTIEPAIQEGCGLTDLEAFGYYRFTGDAKHLRGVRDKQLLDYCFGSDLGL